MVKIINIFGDVYSGQAGKAGVFAKWKGRQYRRKYVIPANPKTTMQLRVRGFFTNAVTFWHSLHSLQRLCFSYLATGLVMSGFNLLVSRWQKAATTGATLPIDPLEGIKQIASADDDTSTESPVTATNPFPLTDAPVKIGSLTFTPSDTDKEQSAYIGIEMGDVRIPTAILGTLGETESPAAPLVVGDQLLITYTSGGRTITREKLLDATLISADTAAEFKAQTVRTAYYPIDFESVVLEIMDAAASPATYEILETLEIQACLYTIVAEEAVPAANIYFDKTAPTVAASKVDYTSYTAIEGAKLEVTKVDTSFITWRRYSDPIGCLPIAQTVEDQSYDWNLSAPTKVSQIRAAQSALLASKHELIVMAAIS